MSLLPCGSSGARTGPGEAGTSGNGVADLGHRPKAALRTVRCRANGPHRAAHCRSRMVLPSVLRPSRVMARASAKGRSRTSMPSPSSSTPPPTPARSDGVQEAAKRWRLGDGARVHAGVEDAGERAEPDARFFFALAADRGVRVFLVEQSGRCLDEHAVGVPVHVGGVAELAGEQDEAAPGVVGQDDGTVAAACPAPVDALRPLRRGCARGALCGDAEVQRLRTRAGFTGCQRVDVRTSLVDAGAVRCLCGGVRTWRAA